MDITLIDNNVNNEKMKTLLLPWHDSDIMFLCIKRLNDLEWDLSTKTSSNIKPSRLE